ncbi:MAG: hypothetical protein ACK4QL_02390 [Pseudanabaenaceae cyanobacterium]
MKRRNLLLSGSSFLLTACQTDTTTTPPASIIGEYRGEFIPEQKEKWQPLGLQEAGYTLIVKPDGKYEATGKYILQGAQGVVVVEGSYTLAGSEATFTAKKIINDGEERPASADNTVTFTIAPDRSLISPPEALAKDPAFPARFVRKSD